MPARKSSGASTGRRCRSTPGYPQFVERCRELRVGAATWKEQTAAARRTTSSGPSRVRCPGTLQYGQVVRWLSDRLPEDAIVASGAGNFASWVHRHFRYKGFRTQLGADQRLDGLRLPGRGGGEARSAVAHRVSLSAATATS